MYWQTEHLKVKQVECILQCHPLKGLKHTRSSTSHFRISWLYPIASSTCECCRCRLLRVWVFFWRWWVFSLLGPVNVRSTSEPCFHAICALYEFSVISRLLDVFHCLHPTVHIFSFSTSMHQLINPLLRLLILNYVFTQFCSWNTCSSMNASLKSRRVPLL